MLLFGQCRRQSQRYHSLLQPWASFRYFISHDLDHVPGPSCFTLTTVVVLAMRFTTVLVAIAAVGSTSVLAAPAATPAGDVHELFARDELHSLDIRDVIRALYARGFEMYVP